MSFFLCNNPAVNFLFNNTQRKRRLAARRRNNANGNNNNNMATSTETTSSIRNDSLDRNLNPLEYESIREESPKSLEDLCGRIRRYETEELRLFWRDCNFLTHPRAVRQLQRVLLRSPACITSVSLGWRFGNPRLLTRSLEMLMAAGCNSLCKIQLIVNEQIPAELLYKFLEKQEELVEIDFMAVRIPPPRNSGNAAAHSIVAPTSMCTSCKNSKRKKSRKIAAICPKCILVTKANNALCSKKPMPFVGSAPAAKHINYNVASHVMIRLHAHHANLKVLKLQDCNIDCAAASQLADYIHIRGGLSQLSLRANRDLRETGLRVICQSPVIDGLDLSLCDVDAHGAVHGIARGIANRPWALGYLALQGNYRMDTAGCVSLVSKAVTDKILGLNMSHCEIGDNTAQEVFLALKRNLNERSLLQELIMQGSRIKLPETTRAFLECVKNPHSSLRIVRMNDPHAAKYNNNAGGDDPAAATCEEDLLLDIANSVKDNFQIEELDLDYLPDAIRFNNHNQQLGTEMTPTDAQRQQQPLANDPPQQQQAGNGNPDAQDEANDAENNDDKCNDIVKAMNFHLTLNRAGRRILRESSPYYPSSSAWGNDGCGGGGSSTAVASDGTAMTLPYRPPSLRTDKDWYEVVATAGSLNDMNVLYWMVRNSADRF